MAPLWLWGLLPLWVSSGGAIDIVEMFFLIFTVGCASLFWLFNVAIVLKAERFRTLGIWLSVPIVWVAAVAVSASDVPFLIRFRLSEPDLRQYAQADAPNPSHDMRARHLGLFDISDVWRHGRTVAFSTDGKLFDRVGVIYAPDGLPAEPLPIEVEELLRAQYTHLDGPWYKFEIGD